MVKMGKGKGRVGKGSDRKEVEVSGRFQKEGKGETGVERLKRKDGKKKIG